MMSYAGPTRIVQEFGNTLTSWANASNSFSYLKSLSRLCSTNPSFRIGDVVMDKLAAKNGLTKSQTYTYNNYITCLQKEIDNGTRISISGIEEIPESMIDKRYNNFQCISCDVTVDGDESYKAKDLFIIRDNKILKIDKYRETVDAKTGKKKVVVDVSDLDLEVGGFGFSYNYDKNFPIGGSASYSIGKFMMSLDFGFNTNKEKLYTTQRIEFSDLMNYRISKGSYDPNFYLTFTPSFFMKYFAIGWGVGLLSMKGVSETTEFMETTVEEDGNLNTSSGTSFSSNGKYKFMMRPSLKGFIPCSDRFSISLSVNYNWVLGYKDMNGLNFGIGFHYLLGY